MAWPSTPLTTYLAGGLPFIKAFDENSYQSAINGIINGTYSLHSVVVDGTGGVVVAGTAGTLTVSATISATGAGMPANPWGKLNKEQVCFGAVNIDDTGNAGLGFNVKTLPGLVGGAGHPVAGTYVVTFNGSPTNATRCVPLVCPGFGPAPRNDYNTRVASIATVAGDLQVTVNVTNAAGAGAGEDAAFSLVVFGG